MQRQSLSFRLRSHSNVFFRGVTIVNCPHEMSNVRPAIGSNAASAWWVNGQEVIGIYGGRQTLIDDGLSKHLTLQKGHKHCALRRHQWRGRHRFLRAVAGRGGQMLKGFILIVGNVKQR